MRRKNFSAKGFTLTEMAVVLVIVALLIGGLMMPLSAQRGAQARSATAAQLDIIREALIGYAVVHGRLPCPAEADIASGQTNAGLEAFSTTTGTCTCSTSGGAWASYGSSNACNSSGSPPNVAMVSGVLPWATLGLAETDAWNNRFSYTVTAAYARQPNTSNAAYCNDSSSPTPSAMPANSAFAICTTGGALIYTAADKSVALTTTGEVPAVVVSHGDNGLGAWLTTGMQIAGATGDELENANADYQFVSNVNIDDMLVWVSRPVLMNRMIAVSKLP